MVFFRLRCPMARRDDVLRCMATLLTLASLGALATANPITIEQRHYCGGDLSRAVSAVCKGQYYEGPHHHHHQHHRRVGGDVAAATAADNQFRRLRRDITAECCDRPCGRQTLQLYCATSVVDMHNVDPPPADVRERPAEIPLEVLARNLEQRRVAQGAGGAGSGGQNTDSDDASGAASTERQRRVRLKNKVRLHKARARAKKGGQCRCRKRKRRGKMEAKSYEIGTLTSAESAPHLIHDFSDHSYHTHETARAQPGENLPHVPRFLLFHS